MKQVEIDRLIKVPKVITSPPKKDMQLILGHYRNDMKLQSKDKELDFSVFMRKHKDFQENFSIGLRYHPKTEPDSKVLIRCNGPHGLHEIFEHHVQCHIHKADEKSIEEGRKEDWKAFKTESFAVFDDALIFFLRECNIVNADQYFEMERQRSLFE